MGELLNRDLVLRVGTVEIRTRALAGGAKPTLKVTFRVERSLELDANTAELSIYNLAPDTRGRLQRAEGLSPFVMLASIT